MGFVLPAFASATALAALWLLFAETKPERDEDWSAPSIWSVAAPR